MSWVRLDDSLLDHPKLLGLSDRALAAWVRGLVWSSRQLTDGYVPSVALRVIAPRATITTTSELVDAHLWETRNGGYQIHDYLDYQPGSEEVRERLEEKAAARSERARKAALARWSRKRGADA